MLPTSNSEYLQLELSDSPELAVRKPGANYHVSFDGAYYSVPHLYYMEPVIVRATKCSIDILNSSGLCIASHERTFTNRKYVTNPAHLPAIYYSVFYDNRYDGANIRNWAKYFGDCTSQIIDDMLESKTYEEQAYKSCIAVLQISKKYGRMILERACRIALSSGVHNFVAIQKIARAEYIKHLNL